MLASRNSSTLAATSAGLVRTSAGAIIRAKSEVEATFLLWHSSPIWSPCAVRFLRSTGPRARSAWPSAGASVSFIQRSRSRTSLLYAPKRRTLPSPSLSVAKARVPPGAFSTMTTGMDGERMPAIGPTAPKWWQGANVTPPPSASRSAASGVSAQPS